MNKTTGLKIIILSLLRLKIHANRKQNFKSYDNNVFSTADKHILIALKIERILILQTNFTNTQPYLRLKL